MQTVYYKTSNFIQHTGNVIDLTELRRRRDLAMRDSLARQPEAVYFREEPEEEPAFRPVVLTMSRAQRRRARQERHAWTLDACASLAVILMTAVFLLRMAL